jgi:hypothetical protein
VADQVLPIRLREKGRCCWLAIDKKRKDKPTLGFSGGRVFMEKPLFDHIYNFIL